MPVCRQSGGSQVLLNLSKEGQGYAATSAIGLQLA